jgi:hypothetical protein
MHPSSLIGEGFFRCTCDQSLRKTLITEEKELDEKLRKKKSKK